MCMSQAPAGTAKVGRSRPERASIGSESNGLFMTVRRPCVAICHGRVRGPASGQVSAPGPRLECRCLCRQSPVNRTQRGGGDGSFVVAVAWRNTYAQGHALLPHSVLRFRERACRIRVAADTGFSFYHSSQQTGVEAVALRRQLVLYHSLVRWVAPLARDLGASKARMRCARVLCEKARS